MRRPLSDEYIKKFRETIGWTLGQKPVYQPNVCIDDILNGKAFVDEMSIALQLALKFAGHNGYIAAMPELIAAKLKVGDNHELYLFHELYQYLRTVHTEENIGVDSKGRFYTANEPVLVIVNGGGILTPERIMKAYEEGLVDGSAKYLNEEFNNLLDGKLPNGTSIELYNFEDLKKGVSNIPHRFGIVMPYFMAQNTESGFIRKKAFLENPLAIARNAGIQNLEEYFEKAKNTSNDTLGCHHPFGGRDASVSQGSVLSLNGSYNGLGGNHTLRFSGSFIAVQENSYSTKK